MAQEEVLVPALFHNLRRALLPLMDNDIYGYLSTVYSRLNPADNGAVADKEDDFHGDLKLVSDGAEPSTKRQKVE